MQCHYCEGNADVTVEKDGIRVGLCEDHFRDRLEDLAESDMLEDLREQLDIDRH
jgi:methyl coenzyme M reductase subunit C-like uncharacterized protein (methanogenesis marker protein 7)